MQTIEIKLPICIYGVSLKAIKLEKCLRNAGFDRITFLDRNPQNVAFRVEAMEPEKYLEEFAPEAIVIIMVMNVYSHEDIARSLYTLGYRYILYKSNLYHQDANGELFDVFNDCLYFENGHIQIEKLIGKEMYPVENIREKNLFLSTLHTQNDDRVIAYVPAEILYSMSKEDYEDIHPEKEWLKIPYDRCSLYYLICGELFQSFENGVDFDYWPVYDRLNRDRMFFSEECFEEEYKRHLKQRYEVYVHMSEMFFKNYDFFVRNPVMVRWNNKQKVFNIIDGNNRTAFLLAKGVYFIPCRMNILDYQTWMNDNEVRRFLSTHKDWKSNMKFPVSNPNFCMYDTGNGLYARKFLHIVLRNLLKLDFEIAGCRMLDAMSDNGFFAYCFLKSGAESYWLKEECEQPNYCTDVCALMEAEAVEEVSWNEAEQVAYNLVILSADKMTDMGKLRSDIVIVEADEDKQPADLAKELGIENYKVIDGLILNGEIKRIILFRKG